MDIITNEHVTICWQDYGGTYWCNNYRIDSISSAGCTLYYKRKPVSREINVTAAMNKCLKHFMHLKVNSCKRFPWGKFISDTHEVSYKSGLL